MRTRLTVLCATTLTATLAACALLVSACSGAADSELFGSPSTSDLGTSPSPGSSGENGSGSEGSGGGSGGSSGSSGGGSPGTSGGPGSPNTDAGNSSPDAGSPDAGWTNPGIRCGGGAASPLYCAPDTQVCCAGETSRACASSAGLNPCPKALAITCDDQSDCPGAQVCCGAFAGDEYRAVQCSPICTGKFLGFEARRFCDPKAPVDECQAIGKSCGPSTALPGYSVCQ